jgi:hypothetical protein
MTTRTVPPSWSCSSATTADGVTRLAADYLPRGVGIIAINSNDRVGYPQDAPENMKRLADELGWDFPFVFDETQEVAKAFRAACTPDFFLFDAAGQLAYRGELDESRPGNGIPVTGSDLRAAIDAVLAGQHRLQHQVATGQRAFLLHLEVPTKCLPSSRRSCRAS